MLCLECNGSKSGLKMDLSILNQQNNGVQNHKAVEKKLLPPKIQGSPPRGQENWLRSGGENPAQIARFPGIALQMRDQENGMRVKRRQATEGGQGCPRSGQVGVAS